MTKFAHHEGGINWETSAQHRRTAGLCSLHKAYSGERAWKNIRDRLHSARYLSRVTINGKLKSGKRERT